MTRAAGVKKGQLTPLQHAALSCVVAKPGCDTYTVAKALGRSIIQTRDILVALQRKQLVGRQQPMLGEEYVSRWHPEEKALA